MRPAIRKPSMNIQEQLGQDLKTAMRAGDKQRVGVIRMALAALQNAQIAMVKEAFDAIA
ncbi:MAG TPA: GatB/YqeY domain-containing protein, partial [Roseiflexaceae bacterium]